MPTVPRWPLLLLVAILGACGQAGPPPPRLVVLFVPCTLRRDAFAPYDPAVGYTPRLRELAAGSVVFERHETESGQSGTDFASIFSATQADRHGVFFHPRQLSGDLRLVGEAFSDAGYETWFLNGHPMAAIDLGYGQGIAPERSLDIRGGRKRRLLIEGGGLEQVLAGLRADPDKRAFVLVNFTVTHAPYNKQVSREQVLEFVRAFPDHGRGVTAADLDRWWPFYLEHRLELEWDLSASAERLGLGVAEVEALARVLEVTYRTSVAELDRLVGGVVDAIEGAGLWEKTVFSLTADHGEALHRPGLTFHWTHGLQLAPEVLGVPWILHAPGRGASAASYPAVTRSIDVFPTLAGVCGVPVGGAASGDGVDLSPALLGDGAAPELLAFSHTTVLSQEHLATFRDFELVSRLYPRTDAELCWVRVRDGDRVLKLRNLDGERWGAEAFDLARDPLEALDLFDPANARQQELLRELERYKARLVAAFEQGGATGELEGEEALERLRELGYAR